MFMNDRIMLHKLNKNTAKRKKILTHYISYSCHIFLGEYAFKTMNDSGRGQVLIIKCVLCMMRGYQHEGVSGGCGNRLKILLI